MRCTILLFGTIRFFDANNNWAMMSYRLFSPFLQIGFSALDVKTLFLPEKNLNSKLKIK